MHAQPNYKDELLRSTGGDIKQLEKLPLVHVSMDQPHPPPPPPYNTHGLAVEVNFFILNILTFSFFITRCIICRIMGYKVLTI